ncbi:MAG TPA: DnaJ domain-containing protein [Chryseolinea sp.]|nr:DnaJ domain-containing protein [Chryseolinea sp.]
MTNYYEILGIDVSANSAQIRAAYKRLAMEYHPDRNPGNVQAEEVFKLVNEAYHTLSDALKKSRYDAMLFPKYSPTPEEQREINKLKFFRWQQAQQKTHYVIDKEYFRVQGLALLIFFVIAGFCFALMHTAQYVVEQKQLKHYLANTMTLKQAGNLFTSGQFDEAFTVIYTLDETDPLEYRSNFTRDSLVSELRRMAERKFETEDFSAAVQLFLVLKKHEVPVRVETLRNISICQYFLENYMESFLAMKELHDQHPNSPELTFSLGMINLEKLNNADQALHYFTLGKKLFEDNLTRRYGPSFKMIMNGTDAPDIYFQIFEARARTNIKLNKYRDAVSDCDWAIHLRPGEGEPYRLRAIAKFGNTNQTDGCSDLSQAKKLGAKETAALSKKYCQ